MVCSLRSLQGSVCSESCRLFNTILIHSKFSGQGQNDNRAIYDMKRKQKQRSLRNKKQEMFRMSSSFRTFLNTTLFNKDKVKKWWCGLFAAKSDPYLHPKGQKSTRTPSWWPVVVSDICIVHRMALWGLLGDNCWSRPQDQHQTSLSWEFLSNKIKQAWIQLGGTEEYDDCWIWSRMHFLKCFAK